MKMRHMLLALAVAAVWGVNFTVITLGLGSFPPLLLAVLRFLLVALPALALPRPPVPVRLLAALGLAWFVGQFALLFPAMAVGMPPGLASVVLQSQAFFTMTFAALALGERPTARQTAGAVVALAGLTLIGVTAGTGGVSALGLGLTLGAAASWAAGNVLMRRVGKVEMGPLIAWLSLVPPLPLLALSLWLEGPRRIGDALTHLNATGLLALVYIAFLATTFGFGAWGRLLKLYPVSTVAPFSLLVPVFGASAAMVVTGETFGPLRLGGMGCILAGLCLVVLGPLRPSPAENTGRNTRPDRTGR